jgi:hypothetical protein
MELHIKCQEQTTYRNMNNVHEVDYLDLVRTTQFVREESQRAN